MKILAGDKIATPRYGRLMTAKARTQTSFTSPAVDPGRISPAGQKFASAYRAEYNASPDRFAAYGYEAMKLTLGAIARAGAMGTDRAAVRAQLFATKNRSSIFGSYTIDKNGDTTKGVFGNYRFVAGGKLKLLRVIKVG